MMFKKELVILIALSLIGCALAVRGGGTKVCKNCRHVAHPDDCTTMEVCHLEKCGAEVHYKNGSYVFSFHCLGGHECDQPIHNTPAPEPARAKRRGHHHEEGQLVCRECCDVTGCDSNLCTDYLATAAPAITTTTTMPAPQSTTVVNPSCRNFESDTFKCAELDKYNFCTDPASVAYLIAHEKCALHCGFCHPDSLTTIAPIKTSAAPTTAAPTASPVITTTAEKPAPTEVEPTGAVVSLCVDLGDANFSCDDWHSFGFCDPASGVGYEVARLRCQKTCGFCT